MGFRCVQHLVLVLFYAFSTIFYFYQTTKKCHSMNRRLSPKEGSKGLFVGASDGLSLGLLDGLSEGLGEGLSEGTTDDAPEGLSDG